MYLTFAWRYFKAKKSANAINIIAWVTTAVIAFATCCQVLVLSVFNGFEDLVKSLYSSFYTDLRIVPATGKTFIITPAQLAVIRQQSYLQGISMIVQEKALLQNGESQTVVNLKGVDDNYPNVSGVAGKVTNGTFQTGTADDPELVVGYGLQSAAGISVNPAFAPEQLTLILPKKNSNSSDPTASISEGNAVAKAVFTIQQDFDNNYAITNVDFIKQQMGLAENEFTAAEIKLKFGQDLEESQDLLQKMMGAGYNVQTRFQQNMSLYNTMRLEKWAIYAVLTLILIIAAFNMVSALTMLVLEKKKDISIIQSMGGSQSLIQKIFLSEGLLLGFIGAASGIMLAVIICALQIKFKIIKLQGGSFLIDYFPVKLVPSDFVLVAGTAAAIALLASLVPAVKASNQTIELR
ncbi:MAG: ABC transporter permease [Gloeobacteraceae cyanobacterium ES-bin-316]|nr:ABC transporter permease [Ferruginibacter sp.]